MHVMQDGLGILAHGWLHITTMFAADFLVEEVDLSLHEVLDW